MADPSGFIDFSTYLGLNDEAGQQMLASTDAEGERLRNEAETASNAHLTAAQGAGYGEAGGEAHFQATGESARKGLASYGEFMKGMADPAARQALLEKTYGKGGVSWLDSAMAGSNSKSGRIAEGNAGLKRMGHEFDERAGRAATRKAGFAKSAADQKSQMDAYNAQKQAKYDAQEEERLAKKFEMDSFDDVDQSNPGYVKLTDRQKEDQIQMRARAMKATGPNGIDWKKYRAGTAKMTKQWDDGQAGDVGNWGIVKDAHKFFMGVAGQKVPEKHVPTTWDDYYARNKTPGAK